MALFGQMNTGQTNAGLRKGALGFDPNQAMGGGNMAQQPYPPMMAGGNMANPYGGNMQPPPMMAGGNMFDQGMGQYGNPFPGAQQWRPHGFQPQQPVDLSPYRSGGGGGGGPAYLNNVDWNSVPQNWDQGGYGGPTPFGGMNKRQRKNFRKAYNQNAKATGDPTFRQSRKQWKRQQRQGRRQNQQQNQQQGGGFDMASAMQDPTMRNTILQSMGPGLGGFMGNMYGQNPQAAMQIMDQIPPWFRSGGSSQADSPNMRWGGG